MMVAEQEPFLKTVEDGYRELQEDPLARWRQLGWEQLQTIGLPTRKREDYRYVRLRKLWEQPFCKPKSEAIDPKLVEQNLHPDCSESCLVFVDGHFSAELSRLERLTSCSVLPLEKAISKYRGFLQNRLKQAVQEENDPFVHANLAAHQEGLFFYLPPNCELEKPVQLLHLTTGSEASQSFSRLHLFIGANARLSLVRRHVSLESGEHFTNDYLDLAIEEGAQVRFVQQEGASKGFRFDAFRATQKKDSLLRMVSVTGGATISRSDYRVALKGSGAEADLSALWCLNGHREAHNHVLIDHQAPDCRSFQLFKGVLDDFSRSSFEGKIYVHQLAQRTDAYQLNQNLLLSDGAHADSKPNLEIFADDVKASHGSTVGQLDSDQLLYLLTRGLPREQAERLLLHGFAETVVEKIDDQKERDSVEHRLQEGLF